MSLNLFNLKTICEDKVRLLKFLQKHRLIPNEGQYPCPKCKQLTLSLIQREQRTDGWEWKCLNKEYKPHAHSKLEHCSKFVEFRYGTLFERSPLSILQILGFIDLWVENASLRLICKELDISQHTAVDWSSICREILLVALVESSSDKLGGKNMVVEIDESNFGKFRAPKWVFGGFEVGTGKVFFEYVQQRNADTLLPIIERRIEPGTKIVSDAWAAYNCLSNKGYEHIIVKKNVKLVSKSGEKKIKKHFRDPETGLTTNHIEATWRAVKSYTSPSGKKKEHIPGVLAKYLFFKICGAKGVDRMEEFLRLVSLVYAPTKEKEPQIHYTDEDLQEIFEDEFDNL